MAYPHCYKTLQLSQLRTFCLAATEGNFTAAAHALGLAVPTVWQQVRSLEKSLDASLLHRHGRQLELTPEGTLLLELLQPHVSGIDSLLPLFKMRRAELGRTLSVASTHYLISYHLPRPIRELTRLFPLIRIKLHPGTWVEMIYRVETGEADLGVISYDPEGPRNPALDYEDLFELQFTLLTAAEHPLARHKRVQCRDLVHFPLILSSRNTYAYKMLERLLNQEDLFGRMHVVLESCSTESILRCVASGIGISLQYARREIGRQIPQVRFRVFDPKIPGMPVAIVTRKGAHLPAPAEEFRRLLRRFLLENGNGQPH